MLPAVAAAAAQAQSRPSGAPADPGATAGGSAQSPLALSLLDDPVYRKAKAAALAFQRKSWEQGVVGTAFLEAGDDEAVISLARASLIYPTRDGLPAGVGGAAVDPLMFGEALWHAAEVTKDPAMRKAADAMLEWTLTKAPRAADGTLYHSGNTIWSDSFHTSPPFLAYAGKYDDAVAQIEGHWKRLWIPDARLIAPKWNEGTQRFERKAAWGSGNGWAAAGMARVIRILPPEHPGRAKLIGHLRELLDGCIAHQDGSGLFHDIVDDPATFLETNTAQMLAYAIFESVRGGWLDASYLGAANKMRDAARGKVDAAGFVTGASTAPTFDKPGVSPEAQAFFLMMEAAHAKVKGRR
ncbi:MAG TPA: glycoside hydrolase family 88 protein [Phycisphaerae bacterium]|nr:glycoside hydrolase family 88 protein [Phycisphaerae bacterium]